MIDAANGQKSSTSARIQKIIRTIIARRYFGNQIHFTVYMTVRNFMKNNSLQIIKMILWPTV